MKSSSIPALLNKDGQPLSGRLQQVLREIFPRFRNRFPAIADEQLVTEILEEAGRRIDDRETGSGPVENLDAYAWVTVLNVARSKMRRPALRVARSMLGSEESEAVLGRLESNIATPDQIEADILIEEVTTELTPEERLLLALKQLGFSSREIARQQRTSVANVDTLFYRVKKKIRAILERPGTQMPAARFRKRARRRTE
jgi:DNA-directed RNA polymerase specialized sigma24 family protein